MTFEPEPPPAPGMARAGSPPEMRATQGWVSLLVVYGITAAIEGLGVSQVFAYLPRRLAEVGLAAGDVPTFTGLFSSLIFVFGIFLVPFWGVWADKYSRRAIIARSAVIEAVVFAGLALATAPWQIAASMLLVGLQLGNTGVMLAALRDVTPRGRVGTATATFGAASPLGFAVGPVLGAFLIDGLHRPTADVFWLAAALSLAVVALLYLGSREIRPTIVPTGGVVGLARLAVVAALSDPAVRRLFLVFGVAMLANQMSRPFMPLLVERANGGTVNLASAIGLVTGAAVLVGALISPVSGVIGDRVGFRRVLLLGLVIGGGGLLAMPLAPGVIALAGVAMVYSAMQAATQAMVFGLLAMEVASERRSATLNLVLLPLYVAGIIGPAIGAGVARAADVPGVFVAAGVVSIVGAVVVWAAGRRRPV